MLMLGITGKRLQNALLGIYALLHCSEDSPAGRCAVPCGACSWLAHGPGPAWVHAGSIPVSSDFFTLSIYYRPMPVLPSSQIHFKIKSGKQI
jgi:hypothetical protein